MLLFAPMNKLEHVWRNSWKYLSHGILYEQRRLAIKTSKFNINIVVVNIM